MKAHWIALPVVSVALGYLVLAPHSALTLAEDDPMPPNAAAEIGLSPEGIAAAGLQSSTSTLLTGMTQAVSGYAELHLKRIALTEAEATATSLSQSLSLHPGDSELTKQYNTAISQVAQLRSDIVGLRQSILETITDGLASDKVAILQTYLGNQPRNVPAEFRVGTRTAAQWHAIELALIAEQRAQRLGVSLNSDDVALLAGVRTEIPVITAKQNIETGAASVAQAFSAAGAMP